MLFESLESQACSSLKLQNIVIQIFTFLGNCTALIHLLSFQHVQDFLFSDKDTVLHIVSDKDTVLHFTFNFIVKWDRQKYRKFQHNQIFGGVVGATRCSGFKF